MRVFLPFIVWEAEGDTFLETFWHWGFVVGRTQTNLWWGRNDPNPPVWQHDVLHPDGTPYRPEEMELLRNLRGEN